MATRPAGILNRTADRKGHLELLVALIAVLGLSLQPASAQNCGECTISAVVETPVSATEWTLSKQVNEVNVLFLASRDGKATGDLSQNDVLVEDDGKPPAAILGFRTEHELPLRVGMVIDTSSSVNSRFRFEQAAASLFLREVLQRDDDLAFVMGFDNYSKVTQDFVHDAKLLSRGVEQLHPDGGTALYDAVSTASQKLQRRPESLEGAIDAAQRAEVTIYAISTNWNSGQLEGDLGNKNLRRLAEQTGGRVLMPPNPKAVTKAFAKIGEELRSRYAISYKPADFVSDGHYRKIKIQAHQAGEKLQIRARKGYYASSASGINAASHDADSIVTLASR